MNFLKTTLDLLKDKPSDITLVQIAKDLKLSYSWICKLSSGDLDNPSYKKLQAVHDYLVKRQAH